MTINRRRAPSSDTSREKKRAGHQNEDVYAKLINGEVIHGTQKADVKDTSEACHSVKSGKKWQVFLYSYDRISSCRHLKVLQECLESFPTNYQSYLRDREVCISFKESYVSEYGKEAAKSLSNEKLIKKLGGGNSYIEAKGRLAEATKKVCMELEDKDFLCKFLDEALFNNEEVDYLAIKDDSYEEDGRFKVFSKSDVLRILTAKLTPAVSRAGRVPEDYNVAGQKTLLRYQVGRSLKNIVEIEIRNDSHIHYRKVRFNMKSKDTLHILLNSGLVPRHINDDVIRYE